MVPLTPRKYYALMFSSVPSPSCIRNIATGVMFGAINIFYTSLIDPLIVSKAEIISLDMSLFPCERQWEGKEAPLFVSFVGQYNP